MIRTILFFVIFVRTLYGFPFRDTPEDRKLKDKVERTIYDTTFVMDSLRAKKVYKKLPQEIHFSFEVKGFSVVHKIKTDELFFENANSPICKLSYNEDLENVPAVEVCIPKKGGYFFGTIYGSPDKMSLRAFYRVTDILNDIPITTYKPKGYEYRYKIDTPVGIKITNKIDSIRKIGYDLIRKRSKLILKKHPELLDFVKDFNKCLVKQSGLDPCAKKFFFNHQYYAPVVGGNFIVPPNYIRITPMYTDVLRITNKAVKKINDHLVFDHLSRIYLTDSPETFRVYLIKRKGKWQIKAIDSYERDPFNPGWLSNLKEHGELQWEE